MRPVWQMPRRELDAEQWAMLDAARLAGQSPPQSPRYRDIGIAMQTVATLRTIARTLGLSTAGKRSALIHRIVAAKQGAQP
jgi:SAP domain